MPDNLQKDPSPPVDLIDSDGFVTTLQFNRIVDRIGGETPLAGNKALKLDASGRLVSAIVSDIELERLQGIQSSVQAQIDGKQAVLGFTPEDSANKGIANGYAGLDGSGLVPASQLPQVGVTSNVQNDILSVSEFTSSTSFIDTALSITLAHTSGIFVCLFMGVWNMQSSQTAGHFRINSGGVVQPSIKVWPFVLNRDTSVADSMIGNATGQVVKIEMRSDGGVLGLLKQGTQNGKLMVVEIK